jgi:hypothetical protein
MRYFLGVEVKQDDQGIFIGQSMLLNINKVWYGNCNMACSPIVTGSKLVKDETGKVVDAIKYKYMVECLMYLLHNIKWQIS